MGVVMPCYSHGLLPGYRGSDHNGGVWGGYVCQSQPVVGTIRGETFGYDSNTKSQ